jgi:hypothetical protein
MAFLVLLAVLWQVPAQAIDIPVPVLKAPTQVAAVPTPDEMQTIRAGYALFQQKRFDDAIAKYKEVLDANPKSAAAMNETVLALLQKKEFAAAIELAVRAADFAGSDLANCYGMIGTAFDMMGQPKKAIEVYDAAIALQPGAGTLYYNKAVTELQSLKDTESAMKTLKRGAVADPAHASTQMILAQYFLSKDLKTPAVLAFARMLIAEPASGRTVNAYRSWYGILNGGVKTKANGPAEIGVNPNQSKEEGDLLQFDLYIPLSQITAAGLPDGTSVPERLVTQVDQLVALWTSKDPKDGDAATFLWTYYLPYFKELRERKFVRPFVYYISQNVGMAGVREWVAAHGDEVQAFVAWNKTFQFKGPSPPKF